MAFRLKVATLYLYFRSPVMRGRSDGGPSPTFYPNSMSGIVAMQVSKV